jgi:hypothetical protein
MFAPVAARRFTSSPLSARFGPGTTARRDPSCARRKYPRRYPRSTTIPVPPSRPSGINQMRHELAYLSGTVLQPEARRLEPPTARGGISVESGARTRPEARGRSRWGRRAPPLGALLAHQRRCSPPPLRYPTPSAQGGRHSSVATSSARYRGSDWSWYSRILPCPRLQLRLTAFWSGAVATATRSNPPLRNTRCTQLPGLPSSALREPPSVPRQAQQELHHRFRSRSRRGVVARTSSDRAAPTTARITP